MSVLKSVILAIAAISSVGIANADGLPLEKGRYLGPAVVFSLSSKQKAAIDHFRTCHLEKFKTMNEFTPYVFKLTSSQTKQIKARLGFAPTYFYMYETYRGFNEGGPHWNLALRFSENQIEIPVDLLLRDKEARQAHEEQGWKERNPCFPDVQRR